MKIPPRLAFSALVAVMPTLAATAFAEDLQESRFAAECQEIRFQRGHSSGTVRGVAPPEGVVCFRMTTAASQTANLKITGRNVMFSVNHVDGRDAYSFTTEKKTYRIEVVQLMRSLTDEPFSLSVSIR